MRHPIGGQSVSIPLLLFGLALLGIFVWVLIGRTLSSHTAQPVIQPPRVAQGIPPLRRPFVTGAAFPLHASVLSVTDRPTRLTRGTQATVVMALAPGSALCGYEVRYVLPVIAQVPGIAIDLVDVEPASGIATPGPQSPAFHGHNAAGHPVTTTGMAAVMRRYVQAYHLAGNPAIHVYVAPAQTRQAWHVRRFPTWAVVNARAGWRRCRRGRLP
ncbi:hypothetical protein [Sulfobacillus harzensis]|uniref:Uncharacterized protein n=1 Tax=Sulfobacillus harzensis TaxID=2729629 RepID=A0A7Y0Q5N2_9FIRM|nr:hypothetical protein [Sulfobacillus harzensis]NMP24484.1 hypothetical protein [Sulfobacillus harzensis]